jgi:hypothetical protein
MSFSGVNHDGSLGYEVPQELHFHLFEVTFLCFEVERLLPQNFEYFSYDLFMKLFVVGGSNDDVVHEPK